IPAAGHAAGGAVRAEYAVPAGAGAGAVHAVVEARCAGRHAADADVVGRDAVHAVAAGAPRLTVDAVVGPAGGVADRVHPVAAGAVGREKPAVVGPRRGLGPAADTDARGALGVAEDPEGVSGGGAGVPVDAVAPIARALAVDAEVGPRGVVGPP